MSIRNGSTYCGHPLIRVPDTDRNHGWWHAEQLRLLVKRDGPWRAEVWIEPDPLQSTRLRIYDHAAGAEWLDASYDLGAPGATPFERAEEFLTGGRMPGWGEWPSEPTTSGRVPMPTCTYCGGPIAHGELVVLASAPTEVFPALTAWDPHAHRACHTAHHEPPDRPVFTIASAADPTVRAVLFRVSDEIHTRTFIIRIASRSAHRARLTRMAGGVLGGVGELSTGRWAPAAYIDRNHLLHSTGPATFLEDVDTLAEAVDALIAHWRDTDRAELPKGSSRVE